MRELALVLSVVGCLYFDWIALQIAIRAAHGWPSLSYGETRARYFCLVLSSSAVQLITSILVINVIAVVQMVLYIGLAYILSSVLYRWNLRRQLAMF